MGYTLNFNDLPKEIDLWEGLPLSLNGKEILPLDYNAGKTGWIIYGKKLDKVVLSEFQERLSMPVVVVSSWKIKQYQVVRFAGSLPKNGQQLANDLELDIAPIKSMPDLQLPGLVVMDMDSTAIDIECINEMAKVYGVEEKILAITEQAMRGEIDLAASIRKHVAALKGADVAILDQVKNNLPIMKGLRFLVNELHKLEWKIVIVTGGFTYFADVFKEKFKLHAAYANELGVDKNGKLTGRLKGQLVDAKYKAKTLQRLAEELQIPLEQTVAIGDGENDLMMIRIAELGVSYHGKPKVAQKARIRINHADLTGLMCILSANLDNQR